MQFVTKDVLFLSDALIIRDGDGVGSFFSHFDDSPAEEFGDNIFYFLLW